MVGLLKCKITVERKEEADKASEDRSVEENKPQDQQEDEEKQKATKKTGVINEANQVFPFNLHRREFLDYAYEMRDLKARAYILQCDNLTAVDTYADLKSLVAGYSANCSANPYLRLQVGDGSNSEGLIRYIDDSKRALQSTLRPRFKTQYAMDLVLPRDTLMKIDVYSKGRIRDSLIGSTTIDLEDRYYGDAYNQAIIALRLYKQYYASKQNDEKLPVDKKRRLRRKVDEVNRMRSQIEAFEQKRNIEFRQLMVPEKQQPQGTAEMWLDVFPADVPFPEYNLQAMLQNKYELRLVIWNAYNIPLSEGVTCGLLTRIHRRW